MHYHLEIIMPPTDNVEAAVEKILTPFNEDQSDIPEDERNSRYTFWDWYVIGGRWAGEKLKCGLDQAKVEEFWKEIEGMNLTVSGLQAGLPKIEPEDQIPAVDVLWQRIFPDSQFKACPFFQHFNNQYKNSTGFPDVMELKDMPTELTASSVIIAAIRWNDELGAEFMIQDSIYNGVNFTDTAWDGKVQTALDLHLERIKSYKDEAREKYTPKPDWLVVTVDYHS